MTENCQGFCDTPFVKFMSNTLFFMKTDGILLLFYTNLIKIPEPEGEPA